MPIDAGLRQLRLLQLFDSQFPVGAFAHSGGLETYGQAGAGVDALRQIVSSQLDLGWGRGDLAAACLAWWCAGTADVNEAASALSARVGAFKVIPPVRDTSVRLGARTLKLVTQLYPALLSSIAIVPPHHAIVVGVVGRTLDLPLRELLLAYAHSLIAGSLAAATRCMPVSPVQAQTVLVELQPRLVSVVDRVIAAPEDALFTCTPALDVRCHQQSFLHTRLFQS
jgi:urease accessory protein